MNNFPAFCRKYEKSKTEEKVCGGRRIERNVHYSQYVYDRGNYNGVLDGGLLGGEKPALEAGGDGGRKRRAGGRTDR